MNVRLQRAILGFVVLVLILGGLAVAFWPRAEAEEPASDVVEVPAPPAPAAVQRPASKAIDAPAPAPAVGAIGISVVDLEGQPVPRALVEVLGASRVPSQDTDDRGVVVFNDVPQGSWKIRVQAARFSMLTDGPVDVVARRRTELEATLEPLRSLLGKVVDPDGNGIDGAQVELWPEGAPGAITTSRTRNGGQFLVTGLEAGDYDVRATHPQFASSAQARARAGANEVVTLQLGAPGEIAGRVAVRGGTPPDKFHVTIERFVPKVGFEGLEARHYKPRVGAHGVFLLTGLAPGTYDLRTDPVGYGPGVAEAIKVHSGRRTDGVVIELSRGATVRGIVTDAGTREPIAGAEVRVSDAAVWGRNLPRERVLTDAQGAFVLNGLAPGRRGLRARSKGFVSTIRTVPDLMDGRTSVLNIELDPVAEGERPQVQFYGIGAVLESNPDGSVAIRELVDGGPGEAFGLQAGDTILQVDGKEAGALGLGRVVEAIRGEEDSTVELLVLRRGESTPFAVAVDRGSVRFDAGPH